MLDKKVMPEWCKKLPVAPVECYVSDRSEEHALEEKNIKTVVSYQKDVEDGYDFTAIEHIGWKFVVPVDPAVRSPTQEEKESRALKLIKDLKDTLSNQITALEKEISEWSTEPTKTTSWRDNIPVAGVNCYVSDRSDEGALDYRRIEVIHGYEPGGKFPYKGGFGTGHWVFAVPVDPKLRDEVPK